MGYTTTQSKVLLGLGVSSISDVWTAFSQNVKDIDSYQEMLTNGQFPLLRGHILTEEDIAIRQQILNIICHFETSWDDSLFPLEEAFALQERLVPFVEDKLIKLADNKLVVLPEGRPFVRNICMAFDKRMLTSETTQRLFSQTV
jgi:oxygen-independent coproporphyrinogen-3 oxidase